MDITQRLEQEKRRHSEETTKADGTIAQAREHLEAMQREFNGLVAGLQQECQRRIGKIQMLEELQVAEQSTAEAERLAQAAKENDPLHPTFMDRLKGEPGPNVLLSSAAAPSGVYCPPELEGD